MAVDFPEVMNTLMGIAGKHPQTTSLLMQSYSLWNARADKNRHIYDEYMRAAATATGPMDQAGIAMQIAAMNPDALPLVIQTLSSWQTRIPDLIQVLSEFQAASVAAAKT